jgi:hypothetical protein
MWAHNPSISHSILLLRLSLSASSLAASTSTNMEMDGSLKGEFRFFILPHDGQEAA